MGRVEGWGGGGWRLRANAGRALGPIANSSLLTQHLGSYGANFATECVADEAVPEGSDPESAPVHLRIVVLYGVRKVAKLWPMSSASSFKPC